MKPFLHPGPTNRGWATRSGAGAATVVLLVVAGCGTQTAAQSPPADLEKATVAGLAAAVLAHFDTESVGHSNGGSNKHEKWQFVELAVTTGGEEIPLTVFVQEYTKEIHPTDETKTCPEPDEYTLSCRLKTMDDGSTVVFNASTEDLTGGISEDGMFANVFNLREHELVMVTQDLPSRDPHYIDLTQLPVDVDVLEEIATDPLVGTRTTAELNDVGNALPDFSD